MKPQHAYYLVGNGALLMLTGLVSGLVVPAAPYPRLMLTAHIQFLVNGMVSVFAGLIVRSGLPALGKGAGSYLVWAHVSLWAVCLSEVVAAFWGAKNTLPIAAAQAGAPGASDWQESVVVVSHMIPALLLIAAWALLLVGVYRGFARATPGG